MDARTRSSQESTLRALARERFSPDISEAEFRVIHDSTQAREAALASEERPTLSIVRGSFLRWLVTDPDALRLVSSHGVQVLAATISGQLDFNRTTVPRDLLFRECVFTQGVQFIWAAAQSIALVSCYSADSANFNFQNAHLKGDLNLGKSRFCGRLLMYGIQIEGDLYMEDAKCLGKAAQLYINIASINGVVNLGRLQCDGPLTIMDTRIGDQVYAAYADLGPMVTMSGSAIATDLHMEHARMTERPGQSKGKGLDLSHVAVGGSIYLAGTTLGGQTQSMSLANSRIAGNVQMDGGFHGFGTVSLWGATIGQELRVIDAQMGKLDCSNAAIGTLTWKRIKNPDQTVLKLTGTHVMSFDDDRDSWPNIGDLSIIGFTYDEISLALPDRSAKGRSSRVSRRSDVDPDDRIAWLELQSPVDVVVSQPWSQLAHYVELRGNLSGSRKVIYVMNRIRARRTGLLTFAVRLPYDLVDENPLNVLFFIALFWVFGALVFWRANRMKAMAPRDTDAYKQFMETQLAPPQVAPFNPYVYALENVLPVVKFGQDDSWAPDPKFQTKSAPARKGLLPKISYGWLAASRWLLIAVGWILALILAGAIGERFK